MARMSADHDSPEELETLHDTDAATSGGAVTAFAVGFVWRLRCTHRDVERRLALHAWQLAQLVPEAQPPAPAAPPRRPRATPAPPLSGQDTWQGTRLR
jgi:hypothetical protein